MQRTPPEDEEQGSGRRYPSRDRNTLQRFTFESQDTDPPAKRRRVDDGKVRISSVRTAQRPQAQQLSHAAMPFAVGRTRWNMAGHKGIVACTDILSC
jgi:hypothetical protein